MHVISILNHKGGVGKTTTTANLGAGLAILGYKVLLIDLDGQENLSYSFGVSDAPDNIYQAMRGYLKYLPIQEVKERLYLVPSNLDLSASELELANEPGREQILKNLLKKVTQDYDFALIDCPPSIGVLTINALTASSYVIIPVEAEAFALKGMMKLTETIEKVRDRLNDHLKIMGVLITKYDQRKTTNKLIQERLASSNELGKTFDTIIRTNASLSSAQLGREDIFSFDPKSNGAEDYLRLSQEVVRIIESSI